MMTLQKRIVAAAVASVVVIVSWCSYTMPSEAEMERQLSCHANAYTGDDCGS